MMKRRVIIFIVLIVVVHYSVDDVIGKYGGKRSEIKVIESNNEITGKVYDSAEGLVNASENIVKGRIVNSERRTSDDGRIVLFLRTKVGKVYKGDIKEGIITIKNHVGYKRDGEEHLISFGHENLKDQEVIFFLNGYEEEGYSTISAVQGALKFPKRGGILGIRNGDFNMFYNKNESIIEREIIRLSSKG